METATLEKRPDQTELIFDRVGDQYFLTEMFEAGNSIGVELPKSRAERKLEKEGAVNHIRLSQSPLQNVAIPTHRL